MNRQPNPPRSTNPNVFSDDYSVDNVNTEETTLAPRSPSVSSLASANTLRSSQNRPKPAGTPTSGQDATENPFGDDARVSFEDPPRKSSLPQKGADFNNRNSVGSSNTTPSVSQASHSNSSRFSIPPRALSPYTGATGPSHPYAMYPQVGVSRSSSATTASTMRPVERPLEGSNAPQHPYAMYPQNVVVEPGVEDGAIPLGFPGHNTVYPPQPNPADDVIGDIVGADGHTEQLPPYTRYPDGLPPKEEGAFEAATDAGVVAGGGVGPGAGAGAENPTHEGEGPTPVAPLNSPPPAITQASTGAPPEAFRGVPVVEQSTGDSQESAEEPPTGVMAFEEKLKTKGTKKVCCGLPMWTLILVCVVIIVIACIAGVIGGVLGAKKAADSSSQPTHYGNGKSPDIVTVTSQPSLDATPISSLPPYISPLPTGHYLLPASPKNQSKFCVADPDYRASWQCANKGRTPIYVGGQDAMHASISFQRDSEPYSEPFTYGAQAPFFPVPTQSLSLMIDQNNENFGPALFFISSFDKLVIVSEDRFPSNAMSKRGLTERDILARASSYGGTSKAGDQPWYCWWNSTMMEFFLYLNETTNEALYSSASSPAFPSTSSVVPPASTGAVVPQAVQSSFSDYPRRIKIEERRDSPDSKAPYCQQMRVLNNGTIVTASPSTLGIQQIEPTPTTTLTSSLAYAHSYTATAMAEYESACYCVSLTD